MVTQFVPLEKHRFSEVDVVSRWRHSFEFTDDDMNTFHHGHQVQKKKQNP